MDDNQVGLAGDEVLFKLHTSCKNLLTKVLRIDLKLLLLLIVLFQNRILSNAITI